MTTPTNDGRQNGEGMATDGVAMPEFLSRHDREPGAWRVREGAPIRGHAYTNVATREMVVPFGQSPAARAIRAHEMIHAKVSPADCPKVIDDDGFPITEDAIRSAEEVRVNHLVKLAGFNIDDLTDGSEKMTGKRIGELGLVDGWNHAIVFGSALIGTKSLTQFLAGIKATNPEMANLVKNGLTVIRKEVKRLEKRYRRQTIASTLMHDDEDKSDAENLQGFRRYTIPLAKTIQRTLISPTGDETEGDLESEIAARGSGSSERGIWAHPIIRKDLVLSRHVDGRIGRKRIASATGKNPRHLDRLLTDPERRIFDRRARGKGGVVLIDQSGSMHLDANDIQRMIAEAPGCVIIGYSHSPRSKGVPNIWIMANRGKVCETIPSGNGGNGVDGPAIRFALTHRRTGEPMIWVCDGYVTDAHDNNAPNLTDECAALVTKNRIHMVHNTEEAVEALRKARSMSLPANATGIIAGSRVWINGASTHDDDDI